MAVEDDSVNQEACGRRLVNASWPSAGRNGAARAGIAEARAVRRIRIDDELQGSPCRRRRSASPSCAAQRCSTSVTTRSSQGALRAHRGRSGTGAEARKRGGTPAHVASLGRSGHAGWGLWANFHVSSATDRHGTAPRHRPGPLPEHSTIRTAPDRPHASPSHGCSHVTRTRRSEGAASATASR
jgi:hypothetical protein